MTAAALEPPFTLGWRVLWFSKDPMTNAIDLTESISQAHLCSALQQQHQVLCREPSLLIACKLPLMGKPRDGFINNTAIKADIVFPIRHPDSFASPSGSKVLGNITSDEVMSLTAQGLEGWLCSLFWVWPSHSYCSFIEMMIRRRQRNESAANVGAAIFLFIYIYI